MTLWGYGIDFGNPWYPLYLAGGVVLIFYIWLTGRKSLSGLGRSRRTVALVLRSLIVLLFVAALSEFQAKRTSDQLTVIYLLDQSESISPLRRKEIVDYVNAAIRKHRDKEDMAGIIVFGREAAIEVPPFDDDVQVGPTIEARLDPNFTNLTGALKLAQASFPERGAKRVVVVSDGNENIYEGESISLAKELVDKGISIDVQPVLTQAHGEVIVEKLIVPPDVHEGQPFDMTVVVNNTTPATAPNGGVVTGRLVITEKGTKSQVVEDRVELPPGKRPFTVRQEIDQPAFYQYDATFIPDDPRADRMVQNNQATGFAHVRGEGRILLIEDAEHRDEHRSFVEHLRNNKLDVSVIPSNQLPTSLPELQAFDCIIFGNVPREDFSDDQLKMFVHNTQHLGCGLVMLGGENSFGAGGWNNTILEEAMPVDFQIKSAKVVPKGALALIMHASELANGNYWQKVVSRESIKALGTHDYCGLLHYGDFTGGSEWLWNHPRGMLPVKGNREKMLALLDRMAPGDMPDFDPAMQMASQAFERLKDAAVKHMIIVSDGDPTPPSQRVIRTLVKQKVTVSTVAVGTHGPANSQVLEQIAVDTGGKYYEVTNNNALPRIFQKEARKVARPVIYDTPPPIVPMVKMPHEILSGISAPLPPLDGYVMTQVKDNPLVEVILSTSTPAGEENGTILASWTYGLGRTVVFTSDAGARWASNWTAWDGYEKFCTQMVVWSMRPSGDTGKFSIATDVKDGKGSINITALQDDDSFMNFLDMQATVIGPNFEPVVVDLKQTHAGRYSGTFDALEAGSYFVSVLPAAGKAPLLTGMNVPYSAEFLNLATNEEMLRQMAGLAPKGGKPGVVIEERANAGNEDRLTNMLNVSSFRHDLPKAESVQDAWFYLILVGCCLFFADVFNRRVHVSTEWIKPTAIKAWRKLRGDTGLAPAESYMERLKSKKVEVTQTIDERKAATRFEPTPDLPVDTSVLQTDASASKPLSKPAAESTKLTPEAEQEGYTSRLLMAKQKVWKEREDQ